VEDHHARREARLRQLGTRSPRCSIPGCPEADPFALIGADPDIVCYEHAADRDSRSWLEQEHPFGQHNDRHFTLPLPGNDHRVRSDYQVDWPREALRNPEGSPLLRAAATVRGWLDVLRLIIERAAGWVPAFLEWLDAQLVIVHGPRWWIALGWEPR